MHDGIYSIIGEMGGASGASIVFYPLQCVPETLLTTLK